MSLSLRYLNFVRFEIIWLNSFKTFSHLCNEKANCSELPLQAIKKMFPTSLLVEGKKKTLAKIEKNHESGYSS